MALVILSIDERELPAHTREEFEEWLRFSVGDSIEMQNANPLADTDFQSRVREISWFQSGSSNVEFSGAGKPCLPDSAGTEG